MNHLLRDARVHVVLLRNLVQVAVQVVPCNSSRSRGQLPIVPLLGATTAAQLLHASPPLWPQWQTFCEYGADLEVCSEQDAHARGCAILDRAAGRKWDMELGR